MRQLSEREAIDFYNAGIWRGWSLKEVARFQLFQRRVCVPSDLFHKAVGELLGRPVYNHEFADAERLRQEYLVNALPPTMDEIIAMLPEEKVVMVNMEELRQ